MVGTFGSVISSLLGRGRKGSQALPVRDVCLVCGSSLKDMESYKTYRICSSCRFHYSLSARERVRLLMDSKGFKEKFKTITSLDPLKFTGKVPYRKRLFKDQRRTGMNEAAIVGRGKINGRPCVLVCLDFGFMGGSMGTVIGEKVALAFEYAVKRNRPLVMVVTSAGVRMQEGVLSLMQMAKTTIAANQFHRAGLPYVCVLASPTTGQAYASFVNLADVLIAEPGAILGFSPLRVLQQVTNAPLPNGAHTSESHLAHGMVDMVEDRASLRATVVDLLGLLSPKKVDAKLKAPKRRAKKKAVETREILTAAEVVRLSQLPERPTARDYLRMLFSRFVELHGDRVSGDDPSVVTGLATLDGAAVMVIGQSPRQGPNQMAALMPDGLRKAQRAMRVAAKFHIPIITLIDTPGPAMTLEAEEHGIGPAIATTLATMAEVSVPTVAVIIGQGGRESAVAFGIADKVLMMENSVFLPISPENAASLMFRDASRVDEAAQSLHLTARECLEMGVIDGIVPEPEGGAHANRPESAVLVHDALVGALAELRKLSTGKLLKRRHQKFRNMGEYTSYFRMVLSRELEALRTGEEEAALTPATEKKPRRIRKPKAVKAKVLQMPLPAAPLPPSTPPPSSQRSGTES
ncbi:MAG: acetyl-CoA carboxylase carboxyl transferase subunit beta [Dehalococcoidia bacterium]|nr:acetyl-CoA carboxylase carboxyl transferase subunit beta [Dehalococcoidia bacterium]